MKNNTLLNIVQIINTQNYIVTLFDKASPKINGISSVCTTPKIGSILDVDIL